MDNVKEGYKTRVSFRSGQSGLEAAPRVLRRWWNLKAALVDEVDDGAGAEATDVPVLMNSISETETTRNGRGAHIVKREAKGSGGGKEQEKLLKNVRGSGESEAGRGKSGRSGAWIGGQASHQHADILARHAQRNEMKSKPTTASGSGRDAVPDEACRVEHKDGQLLTLTGAADPLPDIDDGRGNGGTTVCSYPAVRGRAGGRAGWSWELAAPRGNLEAGMGRDAIPEELSADAAHQNNAKTPNENAVTEVLHRHDEFDVTQAWGMKEPQGARTAQTPEHTRPESRLHSRSLERTAGVQVPERKQARRCTEEIESVAPST
ncbi:hypothetical protein C8R45DRAFT_1193320 [Mycena sanguinolenta]|nr:hypothetical protein C8R45DRAFT_1193320 [Mycena sanguinolenta]